MHSYLRTVGLGKISTNQEANALLATFAENPDFVEVVHLDEHDDIVKMIRYLDGVDMGIALVGDYDSQGEFRMEYYYPFVDAGTESFCNSLTIRKQGALEAYSAMTEDVRIGISLIFYLSDYVEALARNDAKLWSGKPVSIALSALASEAKILLPMQKDEEYRKWDEENQNKYRSMVEQAKNGSQDAIEQLTIDDMNLYQQLGNRVKKEDLYSIVDSFFMPSGIESDQYGMLGEIKSVEEWTNRISGETGYHLEVLCNHMPMRVTVNRADLLGEPEVGRRIKAQIWLQGNVVKDEINISEIF